MGNRGFWGARAAKVLVLVGTRPEAIKMIPVIRSLRAADDFEPVVVSTGQHASMVGALMREAGIEIAAELRVARHRRGEAPSLNEMCARVLQGLDRLPIVDDCVAVLVHGDTSSAAAGAFAAFNRRLPIVHVEAGLRTYDLNAPFPEEGNRQLISRIAALHLAPTEENRRNLLAEGVEEARIVVTGNTSIDALLAAGGADHGFGPGLEALEAEFADPSSPAPPLVLVTAHRRENWGAGIERIAEAVRRLAERYPEARFVVPMHPNPVARGPFLAKLEGCRNAFLVEPREYAHFAALMHAARLVITDSGGVQEEAPALGVPVLVARETTERGEGVAAGTLSLVGTDVDAIVRGGALALDDPQARARQLARRNPYGDGRAAERITAALRCAFGDPRPCTSVADERMRRAVRGFAGLPLDAGGRAVEVALSSEAA